jgi:tetratricopeptide (TPR) repeat protein
VDVRRAEKYHRNVERKKKEGSQIMRRKPFYKKAFSLLLSVALVQSVSLVGAQKKVKYTPKEYDAFMKAVGEATPGKRMDAITTCMKTYPKSELTDYALSNYLKLMVEYRTQGKAREVASAGEKLLALKPGNIQAILMTTEALYQTGKYAKAVQYGEKAYQAKPGAGMAFMLATSYGLLKNGEKQVFYGEKACAQMQPKDCYQILGELTLIFAKKEQWSKAAGFAEKAIQGFDAAKKPAQTSGAEWNKYVADRKALAYGVLGRRAAERGRWRTASSNYQKAVGLVSNPSLHAEAFYYIGIGHWKQNRINPAMKAFARGSVQRGAPHARHCRKQLEKLYKSTHNDSLAGVDEFIQRVAGG